MKYLEKDLKPGSPKKTYPTSKTAPMTYVSLTTHQAQQDFPKA
jgi:hypothetical protein